MVVLAGDDLDLADGAAGEREAGAVLLAHRVGAVAADAEPFAAQREVAGLGAPRRLGDGLAVDLGAAPCRSASLRSPTCSFVELDAERRTSRCRCGR